MWMVSNKTEQVRKWKRLLRKCRQHNYPIHPAWDLGRTHEPLHAAALVSVANYIARQPPHFSASVSPTSKFTYCLREDARGFVPGNVCARFRARMSYSRGDTHIITIMGDVLYPTCVPDTGARPIRPRQDREAPSPFSRQSSPRQRDTGDDTDDDELPPEVYAMLIPGRAGADMAQLRERVIAERRAMNERRALDRRNRARRPASERTDDLSRVSAS